MELIEVLKINGIKLIDSNILHPGTNLVQIIYDCQNSEQIPSSLINTEINYSRNCNYYLSLDDVFSIEEVAKEQECFLEAVNRSLDYYSSTKIFRFIKVKKRGLNQDIKRKCRINKGVEKRRKLNILKDEISQENINNLNMLGKVQNSVNKKIREKNIVNTFSYEETAIYNRFLDYFSDIAENYSLLRDFGFRYGKLKHREPSDFQTDQKLTSAAFTLANKYPVIIIDCDSDITRLIDFFNKDTENKRWFGIQEPIHEILLYSDFKRQNNFELSISYLNKEIVEK